MSYLNENWLRHIESQPIQTIQLLSGSALRESTPSEEDAIFLRQTVFARLNTGGVQLKHQEIRNCLFQRSFNNLLIELSQLRQMRQAFDLTEYTDEEEDPASKLPINKNRIYQKMEDAETVLRFGPSTCTELHPWHAGVPRFVYDASSNFYKRR